MTESFSIEKASKDLAADIVTNHVQVEDRDGLKEAIRRIIQQKIQSALAQAWNAGGENTHNAIAEMRENASDLNAPITLGDLVQLAIPGNPPTMVVEEILDPTDDQPFTLYGVSWIDSEKRLQRNAFKRVVLRKV